MVTVTGSESAEVTEVALVESSGTQEIKGSVQPMGGGDFLVTMGKLPAGNFLVRLSGVDSSSRIRAAPISFQRQSSTRVRTSSFMVTVSPRVIQISLDHSYTSFPSRVTPILGYYYSM